MSFKIGIQIYFCETPQTFTKTKKSTPKDKKNLSFPYSQDFFLKKGKFSSMIMLMSNNGGRGYENVYEDHNKCEYYIRELAN
jgi:hypothetical protein